MEVRGESRVWMSVLGHWASNVWLRVLLGEDVHEVVALISVFWDEWLSHLAPLLKVMGVLGVWWWDESILSLTKWVDLLFSLDELSTLSPDTVLLIIESSSVLSEWVQDMSLGVGDILVSSWLKIKDSLWSWVAI